MEQDSNLFEYKKSDIFGQFIVKSTHKKTAHTFLHEPLDNYDSGKFDDLSSNSIVFADWLSLVRAFTMSNLVKIIVMAKN